MLGEAKEALDKKGIIEVNTRPLRDRWEADFGRLRNEKFTIPTGEGDWDSFTTNRPSTDAYHIINTLASATMRLKIPLANEDKKQREKLSKTEQFPYGVIALRDSIYGTIPEAGFLQPTMAWHATVRGWVITLVYLYEEEGKVRPHIPVWDALQTWWISGSKGILWICHDRYANVEDVKDQYGEDVKPDIRGRVLITDVWDGEQFGAIAENDWLNKKKHDIGHVPVLVLPCGATPLIQSAEYDDTIKNVGESWIEHNRNLIDTESRMGSYLLTMAGIAAKTPMVSEFDSTKGGRQIDYSSPPNAKGAVVPVDVGKGQKLTPGLNPQMTREGYAFMEITQERLVAGSKTPANFDRVNQVTPAAGMNILRHTSLLNIKPPLQAMERTYEFIAHECVGQFKSGDFSKMEIQGLDGSNRRFKYDVKPKDIDDEWKFEAELITDFPQDEMGNTGMAVQLTQAGILSTQTARDKWNFTPDTDLEQERVDREKVYGFMSILARKVAAALKRDGDDESAREILDELEEMNMQKQQAKQQAKGVASQAGTPTPPPPSATTTAATPSPGNGTMSKIRNFLSKLGGTQ